MNMINYTLPGYFTNKQADSICNKLRGKTFFNFTCSHAGISENQIITISSSNTNYTEDEFKDFIISYLASLIS